MAPYEQNPAHHENDAPSPEDNPAHHENDVPSPEDDLAHPEDNLAPHENATPRHEDDTPRHERDRTLFDRELLSRGRLAVSIDGPVVTITLSAPEVRNAQLPDTWQALEHIGSRILTDPERFSEDGVRIVVLRGAGSSFSAGLDRSAFATTPDSLFGTVARQPGSVADQTIASFQSGFTWLADPSFISVAAVQGHAVGAGFQLALACDLILATPDAQFAMAEVTLGLVPDLGGTARLVTAVGTARALEICATGRRVPADEAARIGLATIADDLDAAIDQYTAALTAAEPEAVRAVTRLIAGCGERSREEQLAAERTEQIARIRALAVR